MNLPLYLKLDQIKNTLLITQAHAPCPLYAETLKTVDSIIRDLKPVAVIQHWKGDKGRLFFYEDIMDDPDANWVPEISFTNLYKL